MFTGIIETVGSVAALDRRAGSASLLIEAPSVAQTARPGDSVAVNGACLTVTRTDGGRFAADLSGETLERTTLGRLRSGSAVNLERAMPADGRFAGHVVTGHVDAVGSVRSRTDRNGFSTFVVLSPPAFRRYLVEKGSVAVDGISLTVNAVETDGFRLDIIPHTLAGTTLDLFRAGDAVNLEFDIIAKYVENMIRYGPGAGGSMLSVLERSGFGGGAS